MGIACFFVEFFSDEEGRRQVLRKEGRDFCEQTRNEAPSFVRENTSEE